jgi:uncharacterized protein
MKRLTDTNLVARALSALARGLFAHPNVFVYPQLVLFVFCIFYTFKYLQFDMRQDDLVGANKKYHQTFLKFKKEFPTQDDLVVVAESDDPEKNREFVERLGPKLEAETNLFHDVFYKGDLKMLGSKALLFVPEADLKELRRTLKDYLPFIQQFTHATNLDSLFTMVNAQFRNAKEEENAQNRSLVKALPALKRIVTQANDSLSSSGPPLSPGVTALFDSSPDSDQSGYITFADGRIFIITAQAPRESLNGAAVERLRTLVNETKEEVPGLNVGITGEPVLDHDQMVQSQHDAMLASVASLILCALIFIYGYQETGRPIKATFCLIIGVGYTLGFATLTVGHLNILTVMFVPILIGLAIDYGVHLISRYEEELRRGRSEQAAMIKAMVFTGQGVFTGAFTTAGAFLAMAFTNFRGIQEMGIICGGGLVVCLAPMMTMLPVLLLHGRQNVIDHEQGDPAERRARIENLWLQRPVLVTSITGVLCLLALTQVPKVYFDYNLLHLQSQGLPAVRYEEKLIYATNSIASSNSAPKSVLYGAVIATNLTEALALEQQLTNLPAVSGVDSIAPFLAENQTKKLALVGDIKRSLAALTFAPIDSRPVNLNDLSLTLYSLYGYLGAAAEAVGKDDAKLEMQLLALRGAIGGLRRSMLLGDDEQLRANSLKLAQFQQVLLKDVHDTFTALQHQNNSAPLRIADLPATMRDRFIGVSGKYLLMVNPKKDLWDRQNQKQFVSEVRTVYPDVTGTPVQLYEYTSLLKKSYVQAAEYALVAIVLLVFIHFRSLSSVVLALVPVGVGSLWLGGLMGFFNIPINPANIMTLPLVIGIGVTNGIHILNRFAEEQTPSILARSTGKAVLVSGLTTIAGFGSFMLGKHRGLESLGEVMSIGLAACMLAGLTFLPALLSLVTRRGRRPQTIAKSDPCSAKPFAQDHPSEEWRESLAEAEPSASETTVGS